MAVKTSYLIDPKAALHECNIYGSKEAGAMLRSVLSQGSSIPWPTQLEQFTGSKEISAKPLLKYFEPLMSYLNDQLVDEPIGWPNADVDNYFEPISEIESDNIPLTTTIY